MPAMQPIRNSSPFVPRLCFLTASRCEERCHDTNHYVSMVNVANTLLTYFLCGVFLSCHSGLCKKAFIYFA